METETLGLLSGIGHLPVDVAKSAKERGCRIVAIGVVPDIDPELPEVADVYYDIHIGKIGKIISALKKNKKVIAIPRLEKYGEHINDHQIEICEELEKEGYILYYKDGIDSLDKLIKKIKNINLKQYDISDGGYLDILRKEI